MIEDFIDYFREENPLFQGHTFRIAIEKEKEKLKGVM